jgi:Calcineurin-like phosphoesterase
MVLDFEFYRQIIKWKFKMRIIFFFLLVFFSRFAEAQNINDCDGPYVEYKRSQVIVRSIDSNRSAVEISFPVSDKSSHLLSVHFSNHVGWDFTVPFKTKITDEPSAWPAADKILALSDIEGEFDNFRYMLIAAHVMDSLYNWTYGNGLLVICGDLFDRGHDVAAELWLLYKLEEEAKASGGYVHTILGNHDIMNLGGDIRFVQPRYIENAKIIGKDYMELYNKNSELGRWLRSKNIIEKIGDNLCLHGGISPKILKIGWAVDKINYNCRPFYDMGEHPEKFTDTTLWAFFDEDNISPFWYRGYFTGLKATQGLVDSTLAFYQCKQIIVGHDIIDNVGSFYQDKVYGIDVNEHLGNTQGLLIESGKFYRVDRVGNKFLLNQ